MFRKKRQAQYHIEADEVFLDSKNLPFFDKQQFEGKIEKPISKKPLLGLFVVILITTIVFCIQLFRLQVIKGNSYFTQSINNALDREIVFASRGVIYDRTGQKLAWNESIEDGEFKSYLNRVYTSVPSVSHILGYVKYPKKDSKGYFWRTEYVGVDGIEKYANETLSGKNGARLIQTNVSGDEVNSNVYEVPIGGNNIKLSIDIDVNASLYNAIRRVSEESSYVGGAGALVDLKTGELLALTSFPEYNSNIMTESTNESIISGYFNSTRHPLLNRVINGIYTPGSIVKPFVGIAGLNEGIISPSKKIESRGSITIPNPYNPEQSSVFRDFRADNGWVNIKEALSVSSNIYFYTISGGYRDQKGIGVEKIGEYWKLFGFTQKTGIELPGEKEGVIPSIEWKKNTFPKDPNWRLGDTYNTSIGQYGVLVTPIQMLQAVSMLALDGKKIQFTLFKKEEATQDIISEDSIIHNENYTIIKEGMRLAVTSPLGTGKGLNSLRSNIALKTGTAQVGARNEYINTWVIGFFPYNKPRYAVVILMDKGTSVQSAGAPTALLYFMQDFEKTTYSQYE